MIQRKQGFNRRPKEAKETVVSPPPSTQADKLAEEVMSVVGKDKVIRAVLRDQITGLYRKYDDWHVVSALVLEIVLREKKGGVKFSLDSINPFAVERQMVALGFPKEAYKYVYEAHKLEIAGEIEKATIVRHYILNLKAAIESDSSMVREARDALSRLCPRTQTI